MKSPSNSKIVRYAITPNALWYWIVLTVDCLAIFMLSIPTDQISLIYLRVAVGLSLVFLLPGYSATRLLFPTHSIIKASSGVDRIERVALSAGLSIALVTIIGLLLRYTPWGSDYHTAISLWALTVIFSTTALVKESRKGTFNI